MDTLVGDMVRLEPLATHHGPELFAVLGNDEEAWRWMIFPTPTSVVEMSGIVDRYLKDSKIGTRQPFAVVHKATQKTIGMTSLMDISLHDRTLEVGGTIYAREFWRTGVNTEAKFLLLTEAFEAQNFLRVTLKTDGENTRSQASITRIGGKYEGTLRSHRMRADGTSRDSVYYSILKNEWPHVKASLEAALR
jgi:RimJ/RimL family protein N-acetyltransferase